MDSLTDTLVLRSNQTYREAGFIGAHSPSRGEVDTPIQVQGTYTVHDTVITFTHTDGSADAGAIVGHQIVLVRPDGTWTFAKVDLTRFDGSPARCVECDRSSEAGWGTI